MIPIKYNVRSLFERTVTTLMTVLSIAFVVLVYVGVLALAGGLKTAFAATGDPTTLLVLRDGARSETESYYPSETYRILAAMPGIPRNEAGQVMASGETLHIQIFERVDGTEANVIVRGVEEPAFLLRPQVEIVDGRMFEAGKSELIVGRNLERRYADLRLGGEVQLGRLDFKVVGVFDSSDSFNSEVWGAVADLGEAFRRTNYYSSTRVKAASASAVAELEERIAGDQRLRVEAVSEPEYYERQAAASSAQFVILGNVLAVLMAFGACFAAANTMYAQVAARGREIGTLRALGFRRRSVLTAFVLEAVVLGALAGATGALFSLPLNGISTGTMNQLTFSEITFALRTTPAALGSGMLLALMTGLIGGLLPAFSASRRRITDLLREA